MALIRAGGFSVDLSLYQTMCKSIAEECELLRAKKVAIEIYQGGPSSPGFTHQDDAMVKAAARPEIFEAPCPGVHNLALGGLKNSSLWSHPPPKLDAIPGVVHGMRGQSGKTLPRPEIPEVLGPTMMGMSNATKKVGTLPGGAPNEGITHTQVADTTGASIKTLT